MKISVAEVRRRLPEGKECVIEFVGTNAQHCNPETKCTRRQIRKQTASQMASAFLEGPKKGSLIWLQWKGITADERDGAIFLTDGFHKEEFLKIVV